MQKFSPGIMIPKPEYNVIISFDDLNGHTCSIVTRRLREAIGFMKMRGIHVEEEIPIEKNKIIHDAAGEMLIHEPCCDIESFVNALQFMLEVCNTFPSGRWYFSNCKTWKPLYREWAQPLSSKDLAKMDEK